MEEEEEEEKEKEAEEEENKKNERIQRSSLHLFNCVFLFEPFIIL